MQSAEFQSLGTTGAAAKLIGAVKTWLRSPRHDFVAQRTAGAAMAIRVSSAAVGFLLQIFFARWMGSYEFGIYVFAWTLVLLTGEIVHLGLASVAQKFIPEYSRLDDRSLLRGFVNRSRRIVLGTAVAASVIAAIVIYFARNSLNERDILPLYFACAALPAYALSVMLDGIARSYNWAAIALLPQYLIRPLALIVLMGVVHLLGYPANARIAMMLSVAVTWGATLLHALLLNRRLKSVIPGGPKQYEPVAWLSVSLPVLMVASFYALLTHTDILVLQHYCQPEDVSLYYVTAKTLALVSFVSFSIAAATAHRFSEYHAAGDHERLSLFLAQAIRWTFFPSVFAIAAILVAGPFLLRLFGPQFSAGYPLMFILAVGPLARAAVGPAERLLNMTGQQGACIVAYATAFAINLFLSVGLVAWLGVLGAAIATSTALVSEAAILFLLVRYKLGVHALIVPLPSIPLRGKAAT